MFLCVHSNAFSSLDAWKTSCRHFAEALQLATDQRFAHEYGDTTVTGNHRAAGQTTFGVDLTCLAKRSECPEMEFTGKVPPLIPYGDIARFSGLTFDEKSAAESCIQDAFDASTTGPERRRTACKANSHSFHSVAKIRKIFSSSPKISAVSNHQDLDLQK